MLLIYTIIQICILIANAIVIILSFNGTTKALLIYIIVGASLVSVGDIGMNVQKEWTKKYLIKANLARYEADPVTGKVKFIIPDTTVSKAFLDEKGKIK